MKCEGMPTLRHEEKRVEERNSVRGREGERETERERERAHVQRGERERARTLFGSSFYMFSSPWAFPMQTGPARSAVSST